MRNSSSLYSRVSILACYRQISKKRLRYTIAGKDVLDVIFNADNIESESKTSTSSVIKKNL